MATALEFVDDLRDRLDDIGDTKFTLATKIRWLNRGQAAMFPKVYRLARDASLAILANIWEYNVPTIVGTNAKIVNIEIEDDAGRLFPLERYILIPDITTQILQLKGASLPTTGNNIRITSCLPLTAFVTTSSTYTGPVFSEELPVLYAMSVAMSALVEQRMNYRRMPTIEGANGTMPEDFMTASQFWMQQFEARLEQHQMPLPPGF